MALKRESPSHLLMQYTTKVLHWTTAGDLLKALSGLYAGQPVIKELSTMGTKGVHALKFQSVVAPNGMIGNLFGPVEGRRHDSRLLVMSGLLEKLEQHSFSPDGATLCIYGDPAYPHRVHLQRPFARRAALTPDELAFNQSMSHVRISVEWVF